MAHKVLVEYPPPDAERLMRWIVEGNRVSRPEAVETVILENRCEVYPFCGVVLGPFHYSARITAVYG